MKLTPGTGRGRVVDDDSDHPSAPLRERIAVIPLESFLVGVLEVWRRCAHSGEPAVIVDWSNERYVRVYVRETIDDVAIGWEALALWRTILARLDRAGVMMLGKHGVKGLAGLIRWPVDVVERLVPTLVDDGRVEIRGEYLVAPNFIEAQEANQSEKLRTAESRARRRDMALAEQLGIVANTAVTKRDNESQNVAECHARSHGVTLGHTASHDVTPCCAVPSLPSLPTVPSTPARACVPEKDNTWTVVTRLWEEQERLRHDADPNCRRMSLSTGASIAVEAILAEHTEEECLHVLAVVAADTKARAKGARNWFDGVTNWKPDNFRRALAQPVAEVKREIEWSLPCLSGGLPIPGDGESDEAYATRRATWESEQAKG